MNIRIGITNYGVFAQYIDLLQEELPENVELFVINDVFSDLENVIKRMEKEKSVDVLVSSGFIATQLENYLEEIPLVKIETNGFDILRAVQEAKHFSDHAAVITHETEIKELAELNEISIIQVESFTYQKRDEVDYILQSLFRQGIFDIIGSSYVLDRAKMFGMRGHLIWSLRGVRSAVQSAIVIAQNLKQIEEKAKKLNCVLDYAAEGIVIIDKNGIVTDFNVAAERILRRKRGSVIGKHCTEVLPNTELLTVMKERTPQYNKIQDVGHVKIITNRSPIFYNGEIIGALATFFSVNNIKNAEVTVCRNQYQRNYSARYSFESLVGLSESFAQVIEDAKVYARAEFPILLYGRSGTGKGILAQCIHNESARHAERFVTVDCASIPSASFERELFGSEDSAVSGGGRSGKSGLFEIAHEGTLFLDEVSELPLKIQNRLLRAIENHEIFRVGGNAFIPVNVRIIASSNRDLWDMVQNGTFREDLYYRLNVLNLRLPDLARRKEDIPLFIDYFLAEIRPELSRPEREMVYNHPAFTRYSWPGNIRELRNILERFCAHYQTGCDIDALVQKVLPENDFAPAVLENVREGEQRMILEALLQARGNRAKAAEILGMSRTTLWRKIKELNLDEQI